MDIRNIEYFLHLAKYEHVSATADFLNISQPSLSKHITSLEKELGVKLFDRIGNRISLNKNGEQFAQYAKQAVELLNMGINSAKNSVYETKGTIQIAYSTYSPIIAKCCAEYAQINPFTTLKITQLNVSGNTLASDELDFLLNCTPYDAVTSGENELFWVPQPLFRESYVLLYGPKTYERLGKIPTSVSDFKDVPFVTMAPKDVFFTDITYSLCLNAGFFPKVYCQTDEFLIKVKLVQEDVAVAFIPEVCMQDTLALAPYLKHLELNDNHAKRTINLMRRKKALMTEAALDFWEFVLDYYHLPADTRD